MGEYDVQVEYLPGAKNVIAYAVLCTEQSRHM